MHLTQFSMIASVVGLGFITNLTPRKSIVFQSVSLPYGFSFSTRTLDTSGGHTAQRGRASPGKHSKVHELTPLES